MTPAFSTTFEAIGTKWQIDILEPIEKERSDALLLRIKERIAEFDKNYSRFRSDSLVTEMSRRAGKYELPSDARSMMALYRELYELTDGAMTPLVGQLISDAGYDAEYSLVPKELSQVPAWNEVLVWNENTLTLKKPALLDFGAIGKGYLIDIVAGLIRTEGIQSFSVDAGGNIVYEDPFDVPLTVGLENPEDSEEVIGTVKISNQSICGSSGNRRTWSTFHHIMNPRTLSSPQHIAALWVIAETTMLADGLSTALFFAEPDKLAERYEFEYLIVYSDFSSIQSPGFRAHLF